MRRKTESVNEGETRVNSFCRKQLGTLLNFVIQYRTRSRNASLDSFENALFIIICSRVFSKPDGLTNMASV